MHRGEASDVEPLHILVRLFRAEVVSCRPGGDPAGRFGMRISADAGMPPAVAAEAFRVLIAYTVGFVAFEIGRATSANGDRPLPSGTNLEGLDRSVGDSDFNRGLEWLMNGLASTIEEGH